MHLARGLSFRDSRTRCRKSCFRPGLNIPGVEILGDVEAVHRAGAAPDPGEIRLAVGRRGGRRGQVRPCRQASAESPASCSRAIARRRSPAGATSRRRRTTAPVRRDRMRTSAGARLYGTHAPLQQRPKRPDLLEPSRATSRRRSASALSAAPITGAIRSLALSTTSLRGIGLRGVPRTASTRSDSRVPSASVISTMATRTGSSARERASGTYLTFARWRSTAASFIRGLSCAAWNDAVLSMSITATMCCRQMSGMSRLSTTAPDARCKPARQPLSRRRRRMRASGEGSRSHRAAPGSACRPSTS